MIVDLDPVAVRARIEAEQRHAIHLGQAADQLHRIDRKLAHLARKRDQRPVNSNGRRKTQRQIDALTPQRDQLRAVVRDHPGGAKVQKPVGLTAPVMLPPPGVG